MTAVNETTPPHTRRRSWVIATDGIRGYGNRRLFHRSSQPTNARCGVKLPVPPPVRRLPHDLAFAPLPTCSLLTRWRFLVPRRNPSARRRPRRPRCGGRERSSTRRRRSDRLGESGPSRDRLWRRTSHFSAARDDHGERCLGRCRSDDEPGF